MTNRFIRKIRNIGGRIFRDIQHKRDRYMLKNRDFSIISNNCWGGIVSQYYGLPYSSPTCGCEIKGSDYIKFCRNIHYYLSLKFQFIDFENSKYRYLYEGFKPFPVGKLDDIEVYFVHYHSEKEAAEKWYRRAKRINWNNIIFKMSHRESYTEKDMEDFASLDLPNKLIFDEKGSTYKTVIIPGITKLVGDETPLTFRYMNITKYLNSLIKR